MKNKLTRLDEHRTAREIVRDAARALAKIAAKSDKVPVKLPTGHSLDYGRNKKLTIPESLGIKPRKTQS